MNSSLTVSPEAAVCPNMVLAVGPGSPVLDEDRRTTPAMRIVVVDDWNELKRFVSQWDALAGCTIEENVFYESWMLLPAVETMCRSGETKFVLVFDDNGRGPRQPTLCGFFPLEKRRRYHGLPFRVLSLLSHQHCFINTPLVRSENADLTISAFLNWVENEADCNLFQWRRIRADGPFIQLLEEAVDLRGWPKFYDEDYTRALFRVGGEGEEYSPPLLSGRGRRELKRRRQRLAEQGNLQYREAEAFDAPDWWIGRFLRLEASGWKGRQGTALASEVSHRTFFEETCREASRRGRLLISALMLGSEPIAMQCNFLAGNGCFAFKSAFDETYGRYSPGVLLLLETLTRLSAHREVGWLDSCTVPDNELLNRMCSSRRRIKTITMSGGRFTATALIQALPAMRLVKQMLFDRTPSNSRGNKV